MLHRFRVGDLIVDESRRAATRDGLPISLTPKLFDLLATLLAAGGRVVSREELAGQVWGGRPMVDNVVATSINRLRKALGEPTATLIESVPRAGYRIAGAISAFALGHAAAVSSALRSGMEVPGRVGWLLDRMLAEAEGRAVWLVHHPAHAESRVFKFATNAHGVADLLREAGIARLLAEKLGPQEDICPVLDWHFESAPAFIAMPMAGEHLGTWTARTGWLQAADLQSRVELLARIASAVAASHAVCVLHNDIKPENILVDDSCDRLQVRLSDFGCGELTDPAVLEGFGLSSFGLADPQKLLSHPGWGALKYLAPELLAGQSPAQASDVFSLGVLLYQLVTGDLERPLSSDWREHVPDPLVALDIADATVSDPQARRLTAADLADRLRRLPERRQAAAESARAAAEATRRRLAEDRARQRRPWIIGLTVTLALAWVVTLGLYGALSRSRSAERQTLQQVQALNDFLVEDLIGEANPDRSGRADFTVVEAVRRAADAIDQRLAGAGPATVASVHAAVARAGAGLGNYPEAARQMNLALMAGPAGRVVEPGQWAEWQALRARYLAETDRVQDAEQALTAARSAWPPVTQAPGRAAVYYWLAQGVIDQSRLDQASGAEHYRRALELAAATSDLPAEEHERIRADLADALRMSGQSGQAAALLAQLAGERTRRLGADHPATCFTQLVRARVDGDLGQASQAIARALQAEQCLRIRLGPGARDAISAAQVVADLRFQADDYPGAADAYDAVAQALAGRPERDTLMLLTTRLNAARARHYAGQAGLAARALVRLRGEAQAALGGGHPILQAIDYHWLDSALDDLDPPNAVGRMHPVSSRELRQPDEVLGRLDPAVLNQDELEPDWAGRLAFQRGRLALLAGHRQEGLLALESARAIIAARNPTARINEARVLAEERRWE